MPVPSWLCRAHYRSVPKVSSDVHPRSAPGNHHGKMEAFPHSYKKMDENSVRFKDRHWKTGFWMVSRKSHFRWIIPPHPNPPPRRGEGRVGGMSLKIFVKRLGFDRPKSLAQIPVWDDSCSLNPKQREQSFASGNCIFIFILRELTCCWGWLTKYKQLLE